MTISPIFDVEKFHISYSCLYTFQLGFIYISTLEKIRKMMCLLASIGKKWILKENIKETRH